MAEPDDHFRWPIRTLTLLAALAVGWAGGFLTAQPAPVRRAFGPVTVPAVSPTPAPPSLAGLANAGRAMRLVLAADYQRIAVAVDAGKITSNDEIVAWFKAAHKPLAVEVGRQLDAAIEAGCDPNGTITNRAAVSNVIRVYANAYGGTP